MSSSLARNSEESKRLLPPKFEVWLGVSYVSWVFRFWLKFWVSFEGGL